MTIKYLKIEFETVAELREYVEATQKNNRTAMPETLPKKIEILEDKPFPQPKPENGRAKYKWRYPFKSWTQEETEILRNYYEKYSVNGRMPANSVANLARKMKRTPMALVAKASELGYIHLKK